MSGKTTGAERKVLKSLIEAHGKEAATLLGAPTLRCRVDEVIPTGIDVLDHHVLGIGGLPCGRISELYSVEGIGKTSLMLLCLAGAQEAGGIGILVETENALQPSWAENTHNVDTDRLLLIEAEALEDTISRIHTAVQAVPRSAGPTLIAWDSLASTPTKSEIETGVTNVGERARLLSGFCRRISGKLKAHRTHLMIVNQVREKIGAMFGDKFVTPGGHAVKFHASIRLQLFPEAAVKDNAGDHVGRIIGVRATKNKLYPPWRMAHMRLDYVDGWDDKWSTMRLAKERKLIPPRSRSDAQYQVALQKLGWK